MRMPGLTAGASLYRTSRQYRLSSSAFGGAWSASPLVAAFHPGPATQRDCSECLEQCAEANVQCSAFAVVPLWGCIFPPLCPAAAAAAGAALAVCQLTSLGCAGYCEVGKCCPKVCGFPNPFDPGAGCCEADEHCVDESDPNARDGCCPSHQQVCGGRCCPPGHKCCGNACCPADFKCEQGTCCPPESSTVCNGRCCDGVCDRHGDCCSAPSRLCGGECCSAFQTCCNDRCIEFGAECVGGAPCPEMQACGGVCCASGQFCRDPARGECGTCPVDREPVKCEGGSGPATCCPPNVNCCRGNCCPYDRDQFGAVVCCTPVGGDAPPFDNGEYGCHHAQACIK